MWFRNRETGLEFDIENQDLINNLKKDGNFEEIAPVENQEESPSRKNLNAKLKSLGYDGDLRKLSDEDVIAEIAKLENK
jgi:hypothetical protein